MTPETLPYPVSLRTVNGVSLEVAEAGDPHGPLVILLHGFPDAWQTWHPQIPPLVAAGFRVLLPNMRGYGRSGKPPSLAAYDVDVLARDVIGLADSEGRDTFQLAGHDWGGIVAFWTAALHPSRVERLAVLNAPHPGVFRSYVLRSPTQLLRSWYVGFFQIPYLPETLLGARNFEPLFQAVKRSSLPGTFDESDRRYMVEAWSPKGALTAMLNYYRALVRRPENTVRVRVTVPTLILFGQKDLAEEPGLATASLAMCDDARIAWLPERRHWIQREAAEEVNAELVKFLAGRPAVAVVG